MIVPCGTRATMDCLKRHIYSTHRHLLRFYSKICTILSGILGYIIGFFATSRRMLTNLFGASSESFARHFESKYGPLHPKFFEGSIQAVSCAASHLLTFYAGPICRLQRWKAVGSVHPVGAGSRFWSNSDSQARD